MSYTGLMKVQVSPSPLKDEKFPKGKKRKKSHCKEGGVLTETLLGILQKIDWRTLKQILVNHPL